MKWYTQLLGGIILSATGVNLTGCSQDMGDANIQSAYKKTLDTAKEITIKEKWISIGQEYNIKVKGKTVATVEGKNIKFWGDIFALKTIDGKLLAFESEKVRVITWNRGAAIYDGHKNLTGSIKEKKLQDALNWNYIKHIYNAKGDEIGISKKFGNSSLGDHNIYDMNKNIDYNIDKRFVLLGGDRYDITVKDQNSEVPLYDAILLTCIEDALGSK